MAHPPGRIAHEGASLMFARVVGGLVIVAVAALGVNLVTTSTSFTPSADAESRLSPRIWNGTQSGAERSAAASADGPSILISDAQGVEGIHDVIEVPSTTQTSEAAQATPRDSRSAPTTVSPTVQSTVSPEPSTTSAASAPTTAVTVDGIRVAPGVDLEGLVASSPPGTVFVLEAGVHRGQSVVPKDGMSFFGEPGAVLDGGGIVERAFSGGASGVTIQGLIIENYVPGAQQGAVGQAADDWVIRGNEVRFISGVGVHTGSGSGWLVADNHIHHNGQLGIKSQGRNMVFVGNTIAYNNTQGYDPNWEAGGGKFLHTTGLVLRNNHVHDNNGPGLWTDTDNIDCVYEGNLVEGNTRFGIFHEVSYDCVIRNNTVRNNGKAGIWIAGSANVEVVGNAVTNNLEAGIGASQDPRGSGAYGAHIIKNLDVHHNTITQTRVPSDSFWGWSGIQQQVKDPSIFTSKGNRFRDNKWVVASAITKPFKWADQRMTWEQWRSNGNDTNGTFTYQ